MSLVALVSAKGSPGVSTSALAFTLAWPAPTLLAECDPAGGDLLSGYLAKYDLPTDRGVLPLASAALRGAAEDDFLGQLIDLDAPHRQRLVLPGISDPAQAASLNPAWAHLGEFLAGLTQTVIVDCGRLSAAHPPWPLLARADLVLLVLRPTSVRSVSPAVPALSRMRKELGEGNSHIGLMLIGGGISPREIARHLVTPVLARLPWDPATAAALCGTGRARRWGPLMRSAATTYGSLHASLASRRQAQAELELDRRDTDTIPAIKAATR